MVLAITVERKEQIANIKSPYCLSQTNFSINRLVWFLIIKMGQVSHFLSNPHAAMFFQCVSLIMCTVNHSFDLFFANIDYVVAQFSRVSFKLLLCGLIYLSESKFSHYNY